MLLASFIMQLSLSAPTFHFLVSNLANILLVQLKFISLLFDNSSIFSSHFDYQKVLYCTFILTRSLNLPPDGGQPLHAYVDADYDRDSSHHHLVTGITILFARGVVGDKTWFQDVVSQGSAESKLAAQLSTFIPYLRSLRCCRKMPPFSLKIIAVPLWGQMQVNPLVALDIWILNTLSYSIGLNGICFSSRPYPHTTMVLIFLTSL